jgi:[acyl-carrier-protein] S-malonyltransferase
MAHHMACLAGYRELAGNPLTPYATAGHSLGEYSALVAAAALDFEHGLRLVQERGNLMGSLGEGEMLALPLDVDQARSLADEFYCGIGGVNLPAQTVVGGARADLDAMAEAIAARFPKARPVRLKTEGAFHTYYMVEAAKRFRPILAAAPITTPNVKVLSNYLGDYHDPGPESIKSRLFFQLFHPVHWLRCLNTAFADGVDTVIEFGGGIGTGDSPAEKRPNLESIVRRAARNAPHEITYLPAINAATLNQL